MNLIDLFESYIKTIPVLYHGTCEENALILCKNGWQPNKTLIGGNSGQTKYLYLSTTYEDAIWFANEKGCSTVLRIRNIPLSFLQVDPEDGISDSVEDELKLSHNIPGKVILTHPLSSEHFEICNLNENAEALTSDMIDKWSDSVRLELGLKFFDVAIQRNGDLKLMMIEVTDKKRGIGSKAMKALCSFADSLHKRIVLSPAVRDDNKGTTSQSRLIAFYKRFGFVLNKGRNKDFSFRELMYRNPKNLVEDVWHGTKHNFDQFSIAHTGTGEGNFTFGWGLYFTDKKEIAEWYRDRLNDNPRGVVVQVTPPKCVQADYGSEPIQFEGEYSDYGLKEMIVNVIDTLAPYHEGEDFVSLYTGSYDKSLSQEENIKQHLDKYQSRQGYIYHLRAISQSLFEKIFLVPYKSPNRIASPFIEQGPQVWARECYEHQIDPSDLPEEKQKIREMINAALDAVASIRYVPRKGLVYKVKIPDDTKYLMWDLDYKNQSDIVKQSLLNAEKQFLEGANHSWFGDDGLQYLSGKSIYDSMTEIFENDGYTKNEARKKTSLLLFKHGIAGIKYLDNASRNSKEESHYNYVLFTDKDISVIHKE